MYLIFLENNLRINLNLILDKNNKIKHQKIFIIHSFKVMNNTTITTYTHYLKIMTKN